jgi:biopolymer transport protein ExbB/TolQ
VSLPRLTNQSLDQRYQNADFIGLLSSLWYRDFILYINRSLIKSMDLTSILESNSTLITSLLFISICYVFFLSKKIKQQNKKINNAIKNHDRKYNALKKDKDNLIKSHNLKTEEIEKTKNKNIETLISKNLSKIEDLENKKTKYQKH